MELINTELAQLTLKNVQLIEQSYDVLTKLDEHFLEKLEAIFDEWYEDIKKETSWYRETSGKNKEEKESIFFVHSSKYSADEEDMAPRSYYKWISTATMLGKYKNGDELQCGILFGFDIDYFNLNKKTAKVFLQEQFEKHIELKEQGFQFIPESSCRRAIFLPFKLDLETLINEYPDYDDKAFEPLSNALDTVRKNLDTFKAIATELNQHLKSEYNQ